ncbi:hypothetical protein [Rhizobium sp. BK376]|uniref:hypothetical protein n=1 Tax=Rhizobium sp. BK376 TaxID=2512149 RepID=UPI001050E58F|nr:hypothetical protein [Rhizobium sp. BK376]TCR80794.1 hypothetical protein EV561_11371 [Rhizobium sp. BK376]
MAYSKDEQESIILNAVWDMIDNLVNFGRFCKINKTTDTSLLFERSADARLFNILLVDFLSQAQAIPKPFDLPTPPQIARSSDRTYLFYLRQICNDPTLGDPELIAAPMEKFADWLDGEIVIPKAWFSSVNYNGPLTIERMQALKTCGDIAKHNFARLDVNVRKLLKIMAFNGWPISEAQAYSMLPDFYEWFHNHAFIYYSSWIAEMLNDIRWGIYQYLMPEYARSYNPYGDPHDMLYRFDVPPTISQPLAREMYWGLMNKVRAGPIFPRFTVSSSFKQPLH